MENELYNRLKQWQQMTPEDREKLRLEVMHQNELARRRARGKAEQILRRMAEESSKNG